MLRSPVTRLALLHPSHIRCSSWSVAVFRSPVSQCNAHVCDVHSHLNVKSKSYFITSGHPAKFSIYHVNNARLSLIAQRCASLLRRKEDVCNQLENGRRSIKFSRRQVFKRMLMKSNYYPGLSHRYGYAPKYEIFCDYQCQCSIHTKSQPKDGRDEDEKCGTKEGSTPVNVDALANSDVLSNQKKANKFEHDNRVSDSASAKLGEHDKLPKSSEPDDRAQQLSNINVTDKTENAVDLQKDQTDQSADKLKLETEKLPSKVQKYFLGRYMWYLKRFQTSLEHEMPDTFNMFRIFSTGLKEFLIDFTTFVMVIVQMSLPGSTLRNLNSRELDLYYNMPSDMVRVFPILLLSSIPFGQNVAFPIGYWFPRHLLCRHFWDIQQRHEFALMALKKRLFNARPVFRSLQTQLFHIQDEDKQEICKTVFYKLGSGIHPTTDEILSLMPLFKGEPFHINRIWSNHVNGLLRLHGLSAWLFRRKKLIEQARMLHLMDAAVSREGISSLTNDQLKAYLFLRGVNPTNMSTEAMTEYLESWLSVSRELDTSTYSLLLHLPILLAYNQPTNIVLIY